MNQRKVNNALIYKTFRAYKANDSVGWTDLMWLYTFFLVGKKVNGAIKDLIKAEWECFGVLITIDSLNPE